MSNQLQWDLYFLSIAKEVSKNSKCLSRKIGAVLVKDKTIVSTGYNGPARGVKHCGRRDIDFYNSVEKKYTDTSIEGNYLMDDSECPRRVFGYKSGEGLHLCQAGHAERNALIQAARNGISTKDTTLYCYCGIPCKDCTIEIINSGVKEIVYLKKDPNTGNKDYDNYTRTLLKESNILIREIDENLIE